MHKKTMSDLKNQSNGIKFKKCAHDAVKLKVAAKDKMIKELPCTQDLFGRLLFLTASQNLDLGIVLSYPLTPVPLSLAIPLVL